MGHCLPMTPSLTDTLCTRCGLCCDGTLFGDVELTGPAEATRLEIMGLEIDEDEANADLLALPCTALRGTRCGIYAHRPACCRGFECRLLLDARRGAMSVERAMEHIAVARKQIRRVLALLVRLETRRGCLPLKERCADALAGERGAGPEVARKRAELAAAMSAVETTIRNTFLAKGPRRG